MDECKSRHYSKIFPFFSFFPSQLEWNSQNRSFLRAKRRSRHRFAISKGGKDRIKQAVINTITNLTHCLDGQWNRNQVAFFPSM